MLQTPQPDLLKMADDEFGVSQQIADTAKLAEADKARGLANEGDALDLLEMTEKKIIKTDEGIDFNFEKMNSSEDVLEVINGVSEIIDRKSTRLNSSHGYISYAVFCVKKKTIRAKTVPDERTTL